MKVKEQLLSLEAYKPGKTIDEVKKEFGLTSITKLASNENPFGCSPKVQEALQKQLETMVLYPDGYATALREKLASHLKVDDAQILFGNGSDDIIQMISRALLLPTDNTIMAKPTFPQYRHNAIVEGAEYREVDLIDGAHDLDGMLSQIDNKTKIVWVCNPNNPTGVYIPAQKIREFLNAVPKNVLIVLDEAYCEYVQAEDYPDSISLLKEYPNVMVLRTFSKIYGLASLRIGYGVANRDLIQKIEPIREPFNTNRLAQAAAIAALDDLQFIEQCALKNRQGLEQYYEFCAVQKLKYFPSQGNFILIDFNRDGNKVFHYLLKKGFIVRSGQALGFPTFIRITIGTKDQNAELILFLTKMVTEI